MMTNDFSMDDLKRRLEEISKMFLEIASGNFNYRIERSNRTDEVEALVEGYNMMAEELEARFGGNPANLEHKTITAMVFVVNNDFIIEQCDIGAEKTLFCTADEIIGKPLDALVIEESKTALDTLRARMAQSHRHVHTIKLFFRIKESFVLQANCSVSVLESCKGFIISAMGTITGPADETKPEITQDLLDQYNCETEEELAFKLIMGMECFREADFKKLNEARSLITPRSHWSLDMLAEKVGIEKRTLAKMLKLLNGGATLTDYVVQERMKEAKRLLKNPELPLKEIAHKIGYKNASTFSQIFKKQVGCSPSEYRDISHRR